MATHRGRGPRIAYGDEDSAILIAQFGLNGADSRYIVCSSRLASDIYANNLDYDASVLRRGLDDGWLILTIDPPKFKTSRNPLTAIQAIKSTETIPSGQYRLFIIPPFSSHRR